MNLNTVSLDLYSKVLSLTCIIEILWSNIGIILHFFCLNLLSFCYMELFLASIFLTSVWIWKYPFLSFTFKLEFFIGLNFNTIYNNEGHAPIFFYYVKVSKAFWGFISHVVVLVGAFLLTHDFFLCQTYFHIICFDEVFQYR